MKVWIEQRPGSTLIDIWTKVQPSADAIEAEIPKQWIREYIKATREAARLSEKIRWEAKEQAAK